MESLGALFPGSSKLFLHGVMCQDSLGSKEPQSLYGEGKGWGKQGQPLLGWYQSSNIRVISPAAEGATFRVDQSQGVKGGR